MSCARAACILLSLTACRNDDSASDKPGRSWATPPAETAGGGIIGQKLPRVLYRGGRFLRNPQIITVTFKGDDPAIVARVEQFGDTITRTHWWRDVVDSYCAKPDDCIGEGRAGSHVKLEAPLAERVASADIEPLLKREADAGRLGPLGQNSLLLVYLPKGVTLGEPGTKPYCSGASRAYHRPLDLGKMIVPYAVLPRCGDEAELTGAASHEVLEATTNPEPTTRGFALDRGSPSLAFAASGLEPVDPCGLLTMDNHWTMESGFTVQRAWSNRAASSGHDPCVPARAGRPYFALVPSQPAVRLAKEGESATITLEAAADQSVPSWSISTFDLFGYQEHERYVEASLERSTISVGDKVMLTVTSRKRHPSETCVLGLVSTLGVHSHMWPLAIVMH